MGSMPKPSPFSSSAHRVLDRVVIVVLTEGWVGVDG